MRKAYAALSGNAAPTAEALALLEGAKGYYEGVANARVVSPTTNLAAATKIVAIGSIANEIIKSGAGLYPTEIDKFIKEITTVGTSLEYGASLFA